MDSDSIIKSLKFQPVMSDAQTSRVMFGSTNNKNSKYQYIDKNDLLNYMFRDSVIGTQEDKSQAELYQGGNNTIGNITQPQQQFIDLIRNFQTINGEYKRRNFKMALNPNSRGYIPLSNFPMVNGKIDPQFREFVKLH